MVMVERQQLYIEDFQYILDSGRGSHVRSICPFCNEIRSNKKDKCLSIERSTLAYHCHYCGAKGYLKSKMGETISKYQKEFKPKMKEYIKPKKKPEDTKSDYSQPFIDWFKGRGISEETLKKAKVTQDVEFIPAVGKRAGCMAFNYYVGGELVNVKYRTRNKEFKLVSGAKLVPYNIDSISEESYDTGERKTCLFVEGEMDALTYIECGFPHVISVPNGANSNLEYIDDYIDSHFDKMECIYISVDNDKKGLECRMALLHRFGRENCKIVEYPKPCKDINEVLMQYGKEAVVKCVEEAKDDAPKGLQSLDDVESQLDFMFHNGLQKGATIGVPSIDKILSFKTGLLTVVTGIPSHGKALSLDTPLPTPYGWTTMKDVKVGDKLYDECGNICSVTYITPIQYNRNCYKVTFSDNSEIICDEEHLWVTRDDKARRSEYMYQKRVRKNNTTEIQKRGTGQSHKRTFPKTRTTKEILETLYVENGHRANHAIKIQGAIQGVNLQLPLHPYILGVWLADGSTGNNGITTGDIEVVQNIELFGFKTTKRKDKYGYGILGLTVKLRELGILTLKHIPSQYLRASYDDRLLLLKGLMDSDGTCFKDGTCSYSTSSKILADDFYELIMTMGLKATITSKIGTLNGVKHKINYNISFRPFFNCFTLKRKSCRIKEKYADEVNWRYIRKIEAVDSVPVKCIQVDSKNHMYLCGKSMIPTHNTFLLNFILSRLNLIYDWKAAFFSPEFYPVSLHIAQVIETMGGMRFDSRNYSPETYNTMKEYICNNMWWIDPDDTDITSVLERAAYLIKKKGIRILVIDPFNALTDKERKNQKQDEYISEFLQKLRWFARKYDIAVFLVMHPTKMTKLETGLYPVCDLYNCKGASEIFDKADIGLTVWRNEQEEYAELHVTKIKFRHLGEKGHATFKFNINNGRYVEIEDADQLRKNGINIKSMNINWDNHNYILDKVKNGTIQSVYPAQQGIETNATNVYANDGSMPFSPFNSDAPF